MESLNVEVYEPGIEEVVLTKRQVFKQQAIERMGETRFNNTGSLMTIDEYNTSSDIWVRFIKNGNMVHTNYKAFVSGQVKDVYFRSVYGIGYLGEGDYKVKINGKSSIQYITWRDMLRRCYSKSYQKKCPTYKGVKVCEEWHNFQNFAKFYDDNYYEVNNERMDMDKDLLISNNRVYSPSTVCFLPQSLNKLIIKRDSKRGSLPIGVTLDKTGKKYIAQCNNGTGKKDYIGTFNTPEEAFYAYKAHKELLVKKKVGEYFGHIPTNVYNALINFKVEIDD